MEELKKAVTGVMERVKGEVVKFSGGRMNYVRIIILKTRIAVNRVKGFSEVHVLPT